MELPERDSLGLAMFAAWLNVRVDQIPAENRIHTSPDTMAAWERVAKAAIRAMLDGVEPVVAAYAFLSLRALLAGERGAGAGVTVLTEAA